MRVVQNGNWLTLSAYSQMAGSSIAEPSARPDHHLNVHGPARHLGGRLISNGWAVGELMRVLASSAAVDISSGVCSRLPSEHHEWGGG
jgi:hypothetical protein